MGSLAVVNWRRRVKQHAKVYRGGCCIVCSYLRSTRALQFHHLDPTKKDFAISRCIRSWVRVKEELDKCVLLCSNCHTEVHDGILDLTPHLHKNPSPEEGERLLAQAGIASRAPQGTRTCACCGTSIGRRSTHCKPCHKKALPPPTKVAWPPVEELLREVEATSKRAVGLRLGVSDAAVKKRLVRYLPGYRPRAYRRAVA